MPCSGMPLAGPSVALSALDHVGRWLGVGLAGLINVLNPRLIVLGGLFGRIYPYVRQSLEAELDRRALPASRALVQIVPAALGADAPLLGAAELAFEPLLADPASWLRTARFPARAGERLSVPTTSPVTISSCPGAPPPSGTRSWGPTRRSVPRHVGFRRE